MIARSKENCLSQKFEFAELVAERYQQEFGDRLTATQILEPLHESTIIAEYNGSKMVAGIKLSPFAGSFSARCLGLNMSRTILGNENTQRLIEVSKVVNIGGPIAISKLFAKTYRWLCRHGDQGFVSVGPMRNIKIWKQVVNCSWSNRWVASIHPVSNPQMPMPDHVNLALLHCRSVSACSN